MGIPVEDGEVGRSLSHQYSDPDKTVISVQKSVKASTAISFLFFSFFFLSGVSLFSHRLLFLFSSLSLFTFLLSL